MRSSDTFTSQLSRFSKTCACGARDSSFGAQCCRQDCLAFVLVQALMPLLPCFELPLLALEAFSLELFGISFRNSRNACVHFGFVGGSPALLVFFVITFEDCTSGTSSRLLQNQHRNHTVTLALSRAMKSNRANQERIGSARTPPSVMHTLQHPLAQSPQTTPTAPWLLCSGSSSAVLRGGTSAAVCAHVTSRGCC